MWEAGPERATVVGTLRGEQLAGGTPCIWLLTNGGERVMVAWPDGWSFDAPPATLIDSDGNAVAGQAAGDHVVEDVRAVPALRVGLGLPIRVFHAPDSDKVAGRLARTESLAVDTVVPRG